MRKTSVYLTVEEAEGLRQLAVREGRPQAELIREGIRRVIEDARPARVFRSMAVGKSGKGDHERWSADELYDKVMGRR
jgi:predicted DNA-binding protein